jgi:hypothetical protein
MRELTDLELDAVGGGFLNANGNGGTGGTAILAVVLQRNSAIQVGVNVGTAASFNVNSAQQSNSSSIGSGGGGGGGGGGGMMPPPHHPM